MEREVFYTAEQVLRHHPAPRMKVVAYNIQYGLGKDTRYDLARIASEVEDADSCRIGSDAVGSDHQPVWVDMDF
jgi:endonuclease/exonuclease/phosphatase family metal-dependent hydrolase